MAAPSDWVTVQALLSIARASAKKLGPTSSSSSSSSPSPSPSPCHSTHVFIIIVCVWPRGAFMGNEKQEAREDYGESVEWEVRGRRHVRQRRHGK